MNKKLSNLLIILALFLLSLCVLFLAMILQNLSTQSEIRPSNNNIIESSNNGNSSKYGNNVDNYGNNSKENLAKFFIGSTIAEVREAQGNPIDVLRTGTSQETWFYGNSRIFFEEGIVVEVDDIDKVFNFITKDDNNE